MKKPRLLIAAIAFVLGLAACAGELGADVDGEVETSTNALMAHPSTTGSSDTRTEGSGTLETTFDGDEVNFSGTFENTTSSATGATLHLQGTRFELDLNAVSETDGSFEATFSFAELADEISGKSAAGVEAALKSGSRAVIILETDDNPDGELSVWVSNETDAHAEAGILIPHPDTAKDADAATEGRGELAVTVEDGMVRVSGEFENLTSAVTQASLEMMGETFAVTVTEGSAATEGTFQSEISLSAMVDALLDAGIAIDAGELISDLESGKAAFVNVKTETNAGGELFAFVEAEVETDTEVDISTNSLMAHPNTTGSSETRTEGSGTLTTTFDENEVSFSGTFENTTSSATDATLHLHGVSFELDLDATAETDGSFEASFSFAELADQVSGKSAADIETDLRSGSRAVIIVKTDDNAGGELFVWVSIDSDAHAEAGILIPHPDTAMEADAATDGSGAISVTIDETNLELRVDGDFENLTSAATEAQIEIMGEAFAVTVSEGSVETEGSFEAEISLSAMVDVLVDAGVEVDVDELKGMLESGNAAAFKLQTETNAEGELFAFIGN